LTGRHRRRAMEHKRTVNVRHAMCRSSGGKTGHERIVVGGDRPCHLVRSCASGRVVTRPGSQGHQTGRGSSGRTNGRETVQARQAASGWAARRIEDLGGPPASQLISCTGRPAGSAACDKPGAVAPLPRGPLGLPLCLLGGMRSLLGCAGIMRNVPSGSEAATGCDLGCLSLSGKVLGERGRWPAG